MLTELIPRLYIGNWHDARDSHGFHIVTVAGDSPFVGHAHFSLADGPGNDAEVFNAAVDYVCEVYPDKERTLVHCIGGRSRSAAVITAAAVRITKRPFCEVYDELLRKHDCTGSGARIHPYLGVLLLDHLQKYDAQTLPAPDAM